MFWKREYCPENFRPEELTVFSLRDILLSLRGIKTPAEREAFLNPPDPRLLRPEQTGINPRETDKAVDRIFMAIENNEPIVVYGDYDVDGCSGTAILWENLFYVFKAHALPFIPDRETDGFGLTVEGLKKIYADSRYQLNGEKKGGLIVTVDNGITKNKAIDFAKEHSQDVIVVDHHDKPLDEPSHAQAVIHTLDLCAAGVSYFLTRELLQRKGKKPRFDPLDLVALATVADIVPLTKHNRAFTKHGLEILRESKRPGIAAICQAAGLDQTKIDTVDIGYKIGPRLNAAGRLESAIISLRALCERDPGKALRLASQLETANDQRQKVQKESYLKLKEAISRRRQAATTDGSEELVFVEVGPYPEGVIGLLAGDLVKDYHRVAMVLTETVEPGIYKASVRSIKGFNVTEALEKCRDLLIEPGGHEMAAGFKIRGENVAEFKKRINTLAAEKLTPEMLEKKIKVDCELPINKINFEIFKMIESLGPFGQENPRPVFSARVEISDFQILLDKNENAKARKPTHFKFTAREIIPGEKNPMVKLKRRPVAFKVIGFNKADLANKFAPGETVRISYSLQLNTYNGNGLGSLELEIADIKKDGEPD